MPTKKGRRIVVDMPEDGETDTDRSVVEQEVDDALERAESEVPTKIEARIFRRHPATGNREQITDTVDSDLVTADFLRQNYGGGFYRVQMIGPMKGKAGKMGRGIVKTMRYEIDVAIPPKHPTQQPLREERETPNANGSALDAAVATMLMSTMQQQAQSTQAMTTMMMTMMKDHSAMLAAQLQALVRPERPAPDPLDQAERLTKILQPPKAGGFADFLKDYQAFKELTGDGGGNGDEHWGAQIARAVVPHLLDRNATPEPPAQPPAPVIRREPPAPVVHEREGGPFHVLPEPPPMPNDLLPFADLLPKLRTAKALGLSPEVVAQAILDATDDDDTLEALLSRPGLVSDIHRLAPEIGADWLDRVRQVAIDALRESVGTDAADDDRVGDDSPTPAGG